MLGSASPEKEAGKVLLQVSLALLAQSKATRCTLLPAFSIEVFRGHLKKEDTGEKPSEAIRGHGKHGAVRAALAGTW